jgi:cytochrome c553
MNKWLVSGFIILVFTASGTQAAGDAAEGKAKSVTCLACHGADGNSPNPIWPKLAGQHPGYIAKQLADFKAGARKNDLMTPMALPLSEQDIANLAAYFSGQTQSAGSAAEGQVALGEKIYRAGNAASGVAACSACHGPTGIGNPSAMYPRISGQHAAYVEQTLKDFRAGARANDNSQTMRGVAAHLTDAEITAVAQYVQGLK